MIKLFKKKVKKPQHFYLVFINSRKRFVNKRYTTKATAEKAAKALAKKLNKETFVFECLQGDFSWTKVNQTEFKPK